MLNVISILSLTGKQKKVNACMNEPFIKYTTFWSSHLPQIAFPSVEKILFIPQNGVE